MSNSPAAPFRMLEDEAAAMTQRVCLGFLRCYDLYAGSPEHDRLPGKVDVPDWYRRWIQIPYQQERAPQAIAGIDPVHVILPTGDKRFVDRVAVYFSHLETLDIYLRLQDVPLDVNLTEDGTRPLTFDAVPWPEDTRPGIEASHTLQWICDMTYQQVTGSPVLPSKPRRTGFHTVLVGGPDLPFRTTQPPIDGVRPGDQCAGIEYELRIRATEQVPDIDAVGAYLVMAGVCTRGRHLVGRTQRAIMELSEASLTSSHSPWKSVKRVAEIQARAIVYRSEAAGRGVFNTSAMQRTFRGVSPSVGIRAEELEALDASMDAVQALASNLFGEAIEQTQHRFSIYGLLFATLSLAFSSIAVLDVVKVTPHYERFWVAGALALIAVAFVVAAPIMQRAFRTR